MSQCTANTKQTGITEFIFLNTELQQNT